MGDIMLKRIKALLPFTYFRPAGSYTNKGNLYYQESNIYFHCLFMFYGSYDWTIKCKD